MNFLDISHARGIQVHYDIHELGAMADTDEKWSIIKDEINRVKGHPAIAAYYLSDEPGG